MKTLNELLPIDYVCIDIANSFGLDKEVFTKRIDWVKKNHTQLEQLAEQATEDKPQYIKAVMALRAMQRGEPTGYTVALDSTCSG